MEPVSAASSIAASPSTAASVPPPPPDISAPQVNANESITAIRLIASLTPFVGQRLDAQA